MLRKYLHDQDAAYVRELPYIERLSYVHDRMPDMVRRAFVEIDDEGTLVWLTTVYRGFLCEKAIE